MANEQATLCGITITDEKYFEEEAVSAVDRGEFRALCEALSYVNGFSGENKRVELGRDHAQHSFIVHVYKRTFPSYLKPFEWTGSWRWEHSLTVGMIWSEPDRRSKPDEPWSFHS